MRRPSVLAAVTFLSLAAAGCGASVAVMVAGPVARQVLLLPAIALSYEVNPETRRHEAATAEAREGPDVLRREELSRLARKGDVEAQYRLATAHYRGIGGPVDSITAAEWYRKAAGSNHGRAQAKLGLLHEEGRGVAKDVVRAYMWYTLAVNNGLRWVEPAYREKLAASMTADQIAQAEELAWKWLQEHPIGAARPGTARHGTGTKRPAGVIV